jgi:hypothetical protein
MASTKAAGVGAGGFGADSFQQSFDALEIDVDRFLQLLLSVDSINFAEDLRVVEPDILAQDFYCPIAIVAGVLDGFVVGAQQGVAIVLDVRAARAERRVGIQMP